MVGLFGGVLDTVEEKYINESTGVPHLIHDVFARIETSGLSTKSIFHAAGHLSRIKELQHIYERGEHIMVDTSAENIHDLCAVVIQYYQRLPEPLCTLLLYSDFIDGHQKNQANHKEWVGKMQRLFDTLPEMNKRLFIRSLQFFDRVGAEEANQVSHSYLAYLLGPLFFYDQAEEGEDNQIRYDSQVVYDLFMQLLLNHKELFPIPLEQMPPWKSQRDLDSVSRTKKNPKQGSGKSQLPSFVPPSDEEELSPLTNASMHGEETIPPASPLMASPNTLKKKKKRGLAGSVIDTLKISKIKQQYLGELPETAPPNTMPANYVMPASFNRL